MGRFARLSVPIMSAALAAALLANARAADLQVEVTIEGVEERSLRRALRDVSVLARAEDDDYGSLAPIRRAAQSDTQAMRQALVSMGYYAATVDPEVRRSDAEVSVTYTVSPGPLFEISEYRIAYQEDAEGDRPQTFGAAGLKADGSPTGERLLALETGLLAKLWEEGYPGAESLGRRVEANFETGTATAVFPISSGPLATYGDIVVRGVEATDESYVTRLRTFQRGEIYARSDIEEYREALAETGLFGEVTVAAGPPGEDGETPILVTLSEREPRTLGAGVSYGTDVGPGVTAFWEHRNLFGGGELLLLRAAAAAPRQEAEAVFEKPVPRLPGSWKLSALFENEDTDAFEAQSGTLGAAINKYWLDRNLQTTAGIRYQYADITDSDGTTQTFSSASLPLAAIWNNENDPLNPTDGFRARFLVEPFFFDTQFNRVEFGGATRVTFGENDGTIIAVRGLLGATYGADRADIPATERYFAGGGGSVRGYGYQEAGPINIIEAEDGTVINIEPDVDGTPRPVILDEDGDPVIPVGPIGGASIAEGNLELRQRVSENIQLAAFVDTGTVFDSQTPNFSGDFFVGAGLGVRYFTPVGPIRVDIATPLNRRKFEVPFPTEEDPDNMETVFQDDIIGLYIALGQPF